MEEPILIYLAIILLFGTLLSALANKLKISNVFFIVFAGMVFGSFGVASFPSQAIIIISTLAMVIVVFEHTALLKIKEIQKYSIFGLRLAVIYYILNMIFLTTAVYFLFDITKDKFASVVLSVCFSALIFSISPDLIVEKTKKQTKTESLMNVEELITRPLALIAPLVILKYLENIGRTNTISVFQDTLFFLSHFLIGIIIGLISSAIMYFILNKKIEEKLSYLILISAAIVTYIFSEVAGASGIISITVLGLVFGNFHIKNKHDLEKFTGIFGYIFTVFVFFFIGTYSLIDFSYLVKGTIAFLIFLLVRLISVFLSLVGSGFNLRQKIFMILNIPKGIDTSIILLIMMIRFENLDGIEVIINLGLLFSLYCLIIANVVGLFADKLLKNES